ncbi:MAG: META domain-containing protein [Chloroflexota bacterium]
MKMQTKLAKLFLMSFLFMLGLVACGATGFAGETAEPEMDSSASLNGTSWVLQEYGPEGNLKPLLPDTSVTLMFEDGRLSGTATCNTYFADFSQSGNTLNFGPIGSTRMACLEPITQQENEFLAAMATVKQYVVAEGLLTLTYNDGILVFATAPAEGDAGPTDETTGESKTLFVGPELVDCVGVAPQQCLQVRESAAEEWTLFYGQIIGFEYEPGFEYELRVTETEVANPPADASSLEVTLVEVVSQTAVSTSPEVQPEGSSLPGTSWVLASFGPTDNQTAVLPNTELTLNFDGAQINGNAGCNSYFADATINDDGSLSFGMMGSTLMACLDEDVMQQESDFLAALAQATSFTLAGNQLMLYTPDGSLTFMAANQ